MIIEVLKLEFSKRCAKNPQYSLRAYARSLNIHSATLSAILNNKRKVTATAAHKILKCLDLDEVEKRKIYLSLIENESRAANFNLLPEEQLTLLSGWEHFAILSALEIDSKDKSPAWISERLNIPIGVTLQALELLEKAGLACKQGVHWEVSGRNHTTTTDVPSSTLRKIHREYMEKAMLSMEKHALEERDITGITMAICKKKLPTAKKMITEFRRELCQYLEDGNKEEVYRLNIQLFPLKK